MPTGPDTTPVTAESTRGPPEKYPQTGPVRQTSSDGKCILRSSVNWILTQPDGPPSSSQISFSFPKFENTNEPLKSYAVIVTTGGNVAGQVPNRGILNKTYDDFKNKKTNTYVTNIKETASRTLRSLTANSVTVIIGAGDKKYGYYNGPLEPSTSYWISVAGFTAIEFDNATGTILEDRSVAIFYPFSNEIKTSDNSSQNSSQLSGAIAGAVVGSILGCAVLGAAGFFLWKKRRNSDSTSKSSKREKGNETFTIQQRRNLSTEFNKLKSVGMEVSAIPYENAAARANLPLPSLHVYVGDYNIS
ncbi:receptor-type tyrosine- phosphatase eta [Pelobates cultripes]|uniref:Receptor-type tyrosine- phosphatase eta n=1 Tax=Pelobates cultripes TaxID=61616 RepID=A0AAD1W0E6_PELCU|nr:receptor-type tyrosine- phosphatase eta [Pelobates cultripes]